MAVTHLRPHLRQGSLVLHLLVVGLRPGCHGMEVQFLDPFSGRTVKRIRLGQTWNGHDLSVHHCQVYISERYLADKTYVLNPQRPHIRVKEQERVHFSLANLNGCLVSICDFYEDCSGIWFLMDPDKELWTKQYSLRTDGTIFIPLWILDDGRVLIWVNRVERAKAYDPRTSTWTNLSTVEQLFDVGMYHGSLLCSDIAY
ncbi:hypothetical protein HU200_014176 [Digitaria exilis]|uniref:F-box associated domain-containing protein n=1 Tax=Digitaria exilis TaxID=1010633 RepID=A0A835FCW8_9POAL|nr:hypothetical protein HU200_014176 [Digitaria exilis]